MIKRPLFILSILTGLNFINYIDRTVLAAVLPRVQHDLHLDDFQGGALATAFLIGYFATSPIFGALGDRTSRKALMAFGVLVWSAATYASGQAHSFHALLAARALVGVGEASYAAVAPTIIDDMAPSDRKGRWLGVFYLAIPLGSAVGYLVGGFIEAQLGWRVAFELVGGPGVVLALACLLIREPARLPGEKQPVLSVIKPLLRERLYVRGVLGYCLFTFALGGFAHWAPKYIHGQYGVELDHANYLFGVLLVVAGAIGTGVGSAWGDRWARKRRAGVDGPAEAAPSRLAAASGHLRVCAIASFVGAPLAAACLLSPSAFGFFALIFLCEIALFLSTSPINAVILLSVPPGIRASAMALSTFSIHLLGDLWSPPMVGAVADHSTMQTGMLLLPLAIAGSGVMWLVRPRREPAVATS